MAADPAPSVDHDPTVVLIDVDVRADKWSDFVPNPEDVCRRAIRQTWAHLNEAGRAYEVSVVLADDAFQRELNRNYRGKDKSTNVLSFPGDDEDGLPSDAPVLFGDIILALETVARECENEKLSSFDHVSHLIVHGMLHLAGYDHENDIDAEKMESLEIKILSELGIGNPYLDGAPLKRDH